MAAGRRESDLVHQRPASMSGKRCHSNQFSFEAHFSPPQERFPASINFICVMTLLNLKCFRFPLSEYINMALSDSSSCSRLHPSAPPPPRKWNMTGYKLRNGVFRLIHETQTHTPSVDLENCNCLSTRSPLPRVNLWLLSRRSGNRSMPQLWMRCKMLQLMFQTRQRASITIESWPNFH